MTGGMNVALQNLVYNMYSLDLSKKISSALQTRTRNGTRVNVNIKFTNSTNIKVTSLTNVYTPSSDESLSSLVRSFVR